MLSDSLLLQPKKISDKARFAILKQALDKSDSSWFALARACASSSQLELLRHFYTLEGLHESHALGLDPAAYHMTTAPGAFRLMYEAREENLSALCLAYSCTMKSLPFLVNAMYWTAKMKASLPTLEEESTTGSDSADDQAAAQATPLLKSSLDKRASDLIDATLKWIQKSLDDAINSLQKLSSFVGPKRWILVVKETKSRELRAVELRKQKGLHVCSTIGPDANALPPFELEL
jgi:hypothetical protein